MSLKSQTTTAHWQTYPLQPELSEKIAQHIQKDPIIAQLLLNRNIQSLTEALFFLDPIQHSLVGPDMADEFFQKAASFFDAHIRAKSRVFVFGDYDVDGVTSTSIFLQFLRDQSMDVAFHIPHRFTEGYGLNFDIMDRVIEAKVDLLIVVDCGISNHQEIDYLKARSNTDVFILDHHTIPTTLPDANMVLNPKLYAAEHPYFHLCAAGLAYSFLDYYCCHYLMTYQMATMLDLVVLGTVADIVPLVNENRRLAVKGLKILSSRSNVGIKQLLSVAKCDRPFISARDIGFVIGPRLNAAGRLTSAKACVDLLTSTESSQALRISKELDQLNTKRRAIGETIFKDADALIQQNPDWLELPLLVLSSSSWHSGIIGITASQLVKKYQRPVVLIAYDKGVGRGSARSVPGVNIYSVLNTFSQCFQSFGGHRGAAGFSILPDQILGFESLMREQAAQLVQPEQLATTLQLDMCLMPEQITVDLIQQIDALAPFGEGNPAPLFYYTDFMPVDFKRVGDGSHLKATFSNAQGTRFFDAIGFGKADKIHFLYQKKVAVAFHLELNDWTGTPVPQLNIVDLAS